MKSNINLQKIENMVKNDDEVSILSVFEKLKGKRSKSYYKIRKKLITEYILKKYKNDPIKIYFVYQRTLNFKLKEKLIKIMIKSQKDKYKIFTSDYKNFKIINYNIFLYLFNQFANNSEKLFLMRKITLRSKLREKILKQLIKLDAKSYIIKIFKKEKKSKLAVFYLEKKFRNCPQKLVWIYKNTHLVELRNKIIKRLTEIDSVEHLMKIYNFEYGVEVIFNYLIKRLQNKPDQLVKLYKRTNDIKNMKKIVDELINKKSNSNIIDILEINNSTKNINLYQYNKMTKYLVDKYFLISDNINQFTLYEIYKIIQKRSLREKIVNRITKLNKKKNFLKYADDEEIILEINNYLFDKYISNPIKLYWLYSKSQINTIKTKIEERLVELKSNKYILKIFRKNKSQEKINFYLFYRYKSSKIKLYWLYRKLDKTTAVKDRIINQLINLDAEKEIYNIFTRDKTIEKLNHYLFQKYKYDNDKIYKLYEELEDSKVKDIIIERLIYVGSEEQINKIFKNEKNINKINYYFIEKYNYNALKLEKLYNEIENLEIRDIIIKRLFELDSKDIVIRIYNKNKHHKLLFDKLIENDMINTKEEILNIEENVFKAIKGNDILDIMLSYIDILSQYNDPITIQNLISKNFNFFLKRGLINESIVYFVITYISDRKKCKLFSQNLLKRKKNLIEINKIIGSSDKFNEEKEYQKKLISKNSIRLIADIIKFFHENNKFTKTYHGEFISENKLINNIKVVESIEEEKERLNSILNNKIDNIEDKNLIQKIKFKTKKEINQLVNKNDFFYTVQNIAGNEINDVLVKRFCDILLHTKDIETKKIILKLASYDDNNLWLKYISKLEINFHTFDCIFRAIKNKFSANNFKIFFDILEFKKTSNIKLYKTIHSFDYTFNGLAISPNSEYISTGCGDRKVRIYSLKNGEEIKKFDSNNRVVTSLAYSPDSKYIATGKTTGVDVFYLKNGKIKKTLPKLKNNRVRGISFSPEGKFLASDGIRLWDVEHSFKQVRLPIYGIPFSFSNDGKYLVSGGKHGLIKIWDLNKNKLVYRTNIEREEIYTISFSPDDKYIAVGYKEKIIIWDFPKKEIYKTLYEKYTRIYSISFSPDGKYLASGGKDRNIKIWQLKTGSRIDTLSGHSSKIYNLSFSSDGNFLCSQSSDHTIKTWDVRILKKLETFRKVKLTILEHLLHFTLINSIENISSYKKLENNIKKLPWEMRSRIINVLKNNSVKKGKKSNLIQIVKNSTNSKDIEIKR